MIILAGKAWIWVIVALAILVVLLLAGLLCYLKIRRCRLEGKIITFMLHKSPVNNMLSMLIRTYSVLSVCNRRRAEEKR